MTLGILWFKYNWGDLIKCKRNDKLSFKHLMRGVITWIKENPKENGKWSPLMPWKI